MTRDPPDASASPDAARPSIDSGFAPLASLDGALQALLDRIRSHTGSSRASLFLRDPVSGEAFTRVAHLDEVEEIRVPRGRGIVGAVLEQDRVVVWPGGGVDPDFDTLDATGFWPRSIVAVPVRIDGAVVGVLELLDCALDDTVQQRGQRIADRMAAVLARSSLATQLRPRGERTVRLDYLAEGIIGSAASLMEAYRRAMQVAPTEAAVLITGETGTGKELFARAIHANSARREGPLVKVDCGSLPDTIIENELFGHEKGAFTGAAGSASGRLEQADGGTLFLDEVGELSLVAQTRLLRVLEERVVQRLGGGRPRRVDFRLVAATHRDLAAMVRDSEFRTDLFHRLQVVRIRLPSLRERGPEDILRLVEYFAEQHGRRHRRQVRAIPAETQEMLVAHRWPGNIRELSHAIESAVVLSSDGVLSPDLFHFEDDDGAGLPAAAHPFADEPTIEELNRRYLRWLLERHGGQRAVVAEIAGIGRTTLWRKLKDAGLV
ncbi:MAG: sigma-54-dependent Fis family transcriptional regulator [Deltaproteobacteria bacterium]|nr:MAG: sigma-54-dependent Fis family transcriptional regulator [Deltaproteobacteria bacterium]